ncbi:MAG TPA: 5-formyltetrahydrofolate cyclo-ligase [Clostridiales bacterium]|nr:5-formyltetrahydrofolate cyclo-ligase [Clostridiales bacterium]
MVDKTALRAAFRRRLTELEAAYLSYSNREICSRIVSLPELLSANRVFPYYSVGREVDTHEIIRLCRAMGKPVALPVVLGGGIMEYALYDDTELVPGSLNIPQPGQHSEKLFPEAGDIILVPALSFDQKGYRLGQGGGYYDRFLAGCQAFTVGLCREAMLSHRLPHEKHDIPVKCLVTEKRIMRLPQEPQREEE